MDAHAADSVINWDDGRLLTLTAGTTARCASLSEGELYALLFYNTTPNDSIAVVTLVWSNSVLPVDLTIPGTTADSGPASFALISGQDSHSVSASLSALAGNTTVSAFIVSISMPTNLTGLSSLELPCDGMLYAFLKYQRYYANPPVGWSRLILWSPITQFISVQMQKSRAQITVLNVGRNPNPVQPLLLGATANEPGIVEVRVVQSQSHEEQILGDGITPWVWMNGDSVRNSEDAKISLQQLSLRAKTRAQQMHVIVPASRGRAFQRIRSNCETAQRGLRLPDFLNGV